MQDILIIMHGWSCQHFALTLSNVRSTVNRWHIPLYTDVPVLPLARWIILLFDWHPCKHIVTPKNEHAYPLLRAQKQATATAIHQPSKGLSKMLLFTEVNKSG